MTNTSERMRGYTGPALFSYGFRPFFLGGAIWAALSMALWLAVLFGAFVPPTGFAPLDWHVHELLYGYLPAVIAGFLLTAVPNWTGRLPVTGYPLAALFLVWLAGRIAVFVSTFMGAWPVAIIDGSFLVVLAAVIAREIISGGNTRNLKVLALILLLALGNITFHAEAIVAGYAAFGQRIGIAAALLLIMVIGGRIVPSFTRNWLARLSPGTMPVPFNRLDAIAIFFATACLAWWVVSPGHTALWLAALPASVIQAVRMSRWAGYRTFAEPLVVILHLAYAFIPLGFALLAAASAWPQVVDSTAPVHAWTTGAITLMTLAVMTRATLGHTGRPLAATPPVVAIYGAALISAVARVVAALDIGGPMMLNLSAIMWLITFVGFVVAFGPMLYRPRASRKRV